MNFDIFTEIISKIKHLPLPGAVSHYKMAPSMRADEMKRAAMKPLKPKKAAVLALFYPDTKHVTRLALILRKTYKGVHSNQVGFPGGKLEREDPDFKSAALRETYEEVGVNPKYVEVFKTLSELYIPPSNFMVIPFMGMMDTTPQFILQEKEVARIIEARVSDVLDDATVQYETLSTSYAKAIEVPVFKLNGYTVWGATAMMLSEIRELFRQSAVL